MNTAELQRRLIALGYNLGPGGADGHCGEFTDAAVCDFLIARAAL